MTDDVLDSHAGRAARNGRGRAVALVAALAAVAAFVAWRADVPPRDPRAAATPSASPSPTPSPEPVVPVPVAPVEVATPAPGPTRIDAPPAAGPNDPLVAVRDGKLLRLEGRRPRTLGSTTGFPRLFRVRGGMVVAEPNGYESGFVRYFPDAGGPSLVGSGTVAFAALDPSSVWIGEQTANATTLRRHDVRTGAVRQQTTLPKGHRPVTEVASGIAADVDGGEPFGTSVVWSPTRHRVVHRLPGRIASANRSAVLVGPVQHCRGGCFTLVNLVTGSTDLVEDVFFAATTPALSPDGRWVAAFQDDGRAGPMQFLVHDRRRGVTDVVPGADLSGDAAVSFAWTADSRRLYLGLSLFPHDTGQVLVWEPRTTTLRSLYDQPVQSLAVA